MIGVCFQAISVCASSPLFVGSPLQNFHASWDEPFTLSRNTDLEDLNPKYKSLNMFWTCPEI